MRLARALIALLAAAMAVAALGVPVLGAGGGVEYNEAAVWVPADYRGNLLVYMAPMNVSDPSLATADSLYVIDQNGQPYYSYLFSSYPPLAVWADPSAGSRAYSLFYGGSNPYPSYIARPGGTVPLFAAFDDFSYDSGLWIYTGAHSISSGHLILSSRSAAFMNATYAPGAVALWLVRYGERGTMIQLYSPTGYTGWILVRLTDENFHDWNNIRNGLDIYFTDTRGDPLDYTFARLDLENHVIEALIYASLQPGEPTTIFMHYGSTNPYISHLVSLTARPPVVDATQPMQATIQAQAVKAPTQSPETIQINTTANITPNTVIAPHLYNWYFDGMDDYIVYNGYNYPQNDAFQYFTVAFKFRDTEYTTWRKVVSFSYQGQRYGLGQFGEGGGNDYYAQISNGSIGSQSIGYGSNLGNPLNWKWSPDGFYTVGWSYDAVNGRLYGFRDDGWVYSCIVDREGYGDLVGGFTEVWVAKAGYWKGYLSFVYLSDKLNQTDIIYGSHVVSNAIVLLDPTFFNGTHYFDLASGAVGTPYGGVARVPAERLWLWVIEGLYGDGLVHLRWFPAGSVVRFVNASSGAPVATAYVYGPGSVGGAVGDYALPLPPGEYIVEAVVPAPGSQPPYSQPMLLAGAPEGLSEGQARLTAGGGAVWVEYSGAEGEVAWYARGPYNILNPDAITGIDAQPPFPYWYNPTSTPPSSTQTPLPPPVPWLGHTLTTNITITQGNTTIIAPHLFNWWFDGDADYVSFDSYPTPQKLYVYVYANVVGGHTSNPRLATTGSNVHFTHRGWMLRVALPYKYVWFTVGNGTYALEVSYSLGDISGWHTYMGGYDNTTGTIYAGADGTLSSASGGPIVYGNYKLLIGADIPSTDFLKGYIAYVLLSSSQQDPVTQIINNTLFLADPTFFNGTHYLDLVSGAVGTPHGGVYRVPANETWLWVVEGVGGFTGVSFRWFPAWSYARVYYSNGTLAWEGYISGPLAPTGFVEQMNLTLPPGEYRVEVTLTPPYLRISYTGTLDNNMAIAPHLFNWFFPGDIHGYMILDFNNAGWVNTSLHAGAYAKAFDRGFFFSWTNTWASHTGFQLKLDYGIASWSVIGNGTVMDNYYISAPSNEMFNHWHLYAFRFNEGFIRLFYDDTNVRYTTDFKYYKPATGETLYIGCVTPGGYPFKGEIAYLFVGDTAWLGIENLTQYKIIYPTQTHLFDATWYNGSAYLDHQSMYSLLPGSSVARVPAERLWLWVIEGLYSDGYLHLRFVPAGTIVRLYSSPSSPGPFAVFVVPWSGVNGAGIVEDYRYRLPGWWHKRTTRIELLVPSWAVLGLAGYRGVAGAVGGGAASLEAGGGWSGYWGLRLDSVVDLALLDYVGGLVFEVRANSSVVLGLYNSTPGSDGGLIAALVVGAGYSYFTCPADSLAFTVNYTASGWVYAFIAVLANGTIVYGAGPGDYPGLYNASNMYIARYTPARPPPHRGLVGILVGAPSGGGETLVDWVRVRVGAGPPQAGAALTAQAVAPVGLYSYAVNASGGAWTAVLELAGAGAWRLEAPGAGHSWAVSYGLVGGAWIAGGGYVVNGSAVYLLRDGEVVSAAPADIPPGAPVVVAYNGSRIEVGYYEGSEYVVAASFNVSDTVYQPVRLASSPGPGGVEWLAPAYALVQPVEAVYTTIVPAGNTTGTVRLGWTGKWNTTAGVQVPVDFYVELAGGNATLALSYNGTVESRAIGYISSPAVVAVGFDYVNNTRTIQVYAMVAWSVESGGGLTTRYRLARVVYTAPEPLNVTGLIPFVETNGTALLVDRFGVTLGDALNLLTKGSLTMRIAGPIPIGGIVKYVAVSKPISVRLEQGKVIVEPDPAARGIRLKGFRGWTLNLAVYGTSIQNVMITSDSYDVDFPLGFTAVIIVDVSGRAISIISAAPPPSVMEGRASLEPGYHAPEIAPPPPRAAPGLAAPSTTVLAAALVALAVAAYRLGANVGAGLAVAGTVVAILAVALNWGPATLFLGLAALLAGWAYYMAQRYAGA